MERTIPWSLEVLHEAIDANRELLFLTMVLFGHFWMKL